MAYSHDMSPFPSTKVIDLCDQFEALPYSSAFDSVMNKYLIDHRIEYNSEEPIHLTNDTLSESLADTFFFPHSSVLSNMTMTMVSSNEKAWALEGEFNVGDQQYCILASPEMCTLSGEDTDGNLLTTSTEHFRILSLLTHIIAQENSSDPRPILEKLSELSPHDGYRKMLTKLGNLNGRVSVTRTAELPCEYDDRAIIATLFEQESPRVSGFNAKLMLNWQIFDTNTETIANMNEVRTGDRDHPNASVRYFERNGTIVPTDEYLISKQIPELYSGEYTANNTLIDSREDQSAWMHTSAMFMTTIGPLLEEFRPLDEI